MAWTAPFTATASGDFTAATWNTHVRDNFAETEPAKAATAGGIICASGANTVAQRTPTIARVDTSQTRSSTTFGDLTTVGPTVSSLATGSAAIVAVTAFVSSDTAARGGYMGVTVSGATTSAATAERSLRIMSGGAGEISRESYVGFIALTAGSNTFTAKYATVTSGIATFSFRELLVIPL